MGVSVVLDTNALWADSALRGPAVGQLLAMSRRDLVDVHIPVVVLEELRRHRLTVIANKLDQLRAMRRKTSTALRELGVTASQLGVDLPPMPALTLEDLARVYIEEVANRIADNSVSVLDLPSVAVADLLERDLAGRRPFDQTGKGFRDALIWANVVELCGELGPSDSVFLVTNDSNFGLDGLAPELLGELRDGGCSLTRAADLADLLGRPELQERKLRVDQALRTVPAGVASRIAERGVRSALNELELHDLTESERAMLQVPLEFEEVRVEWVDDARDFTWNAYDEFDGSTVLGQASMLVDLHLIGAFDNDAELDWLDDADIDDLDADGMRAYGRMVREARAEFDVRVEVMAGDAETVDFEGLRPR